MHLMIILFALGCAVGLRLIPLPQGGSWHQRWQKSLFLFVCPPLVLLMTALAVLWMGTKGEMLGLQASWFSYFLALGFIGWGILTVIKLIGQLWQSQYRIHRLSQQLVMGKTARILEDDFPYSAQIGFWQPKLVVSKGRGFWFVDDSDNRQHKLLQKKPLEPLTDVRECNGFQKPDIPGVF